MIKKEGSEIVLYSSDGSRVLGRFPFGPGKKYPDETAARAAAHKREGQIQAFKKHAEATGKGQGQGKPRQQTGGADSCYCTKCDHKQKHERGKPCITLKCPKCGAPMTGVAKGVGAVTKHSESDTYAEIPALCIFEHEPGRDPYNEERLDEIVANFSGEGVPGRIKRILGETSINPMVIGHGEKQEMLEREDLPAAGWPHRLWREGRKLIANIKSIPVEVKRAVDNKAYRTISSEFYTNYRGLGAALRRIALLGGIVPAKKTLGEIAFQTYSEDEGEVQAFSRFMEDPKMDLEKMSLEELRAAVQKSETDLTAEKAKFAEKEKTDVEVTAAHALELEDKAKQIAELEKAKVDRYLELERGKNTSAAQDLVREQQEKEALAQTADELRKRVGELEAKNMAVEINRFADRFQHNKGIHDQGAIKTVKETLFKIAISKFAEGETAPKLVMSMLDAVTPTVTKPGASIVVDEGLGEFDENDTREKAAYEKWAEGENMSAEDRKEYGMDWWKREVCKA